MGKAVLEGLKGVAKIDNGFHNLKETNTVYYDPSTITVEDMADALKKADTYIGIAK
ncbi:MAG: hypothetical protein JSU83_16205 [Deltaproteobacteria bacterium]|nr:MAG: hypothetical protein JSU83_16205 [Deltaproteobacteria bacterium]